MNLVERLRTCRAAGEDTCQEAADRIEQLEAEIATLCRQLNEQTDSVSVARYNNDMAEREATIKTMREALFDIATFTPDETAWRVAKECFSLPAPTDHLMAYRDSVIEECANRLSSLGFVGSSIEFVQCKCIDTIRAMKEKTCTTK
jgi:hypothetical protein